MVASTSHLDSLFEFDRDTFVFANELVWQYHFDVNGRMSFSRNRPRPSYTHRCFVVVKAARLFHYHARFSPSPGMKEKEFYRRLIRQVISRNPRKPSLEEQRIVIPGYSGLREFSATLEPVLKAELGGAWRSYFLRSHWRMVFPIWRAHQEQVARQLQLALQSGRAPIVHIFRFPQLTINHGILLFRARDCDGEIRFDAYDPNIPGQPVQLIYHKSSRHFSFPPTLYWNGGPLSVVEIFCGGLY